MHPFFDPTLKHKGPTGKKPVGPNDSMIAAAARLWPATFQIYFDRAARLSHSQWFTVNRDHRFCCTKVIMSGVNGNVIMSVCRDDNPDNERRKAARDNTKSVSRGADGGGGWDGDRSQ